MMNPKSWKKAFRVGKEMPKQNVVKKAAMEMNSMEVDEYAIACGVPLEILTDDFGVEACTSQRKSTKYLKFPYYDTDGEEKAHRMLYPSGKMVWSRGNKADHMPYGLWHIGDIWRKGYVVLTEHEMDTQIMTYLGIPALGIVDSSALSNVLVFIEGLRVFVEVSSGIGDRLRALLRQHHGLKRQDVIDFDIGVCGVDSVAELLRRDGHKASFAKVRMLLFDAREYGGTSATDNYPRALKGAPANFRQPGEYLISEDGIFVFEEKKEVFTLICRTPMLLSKRIKNRDTDEEKTEVSFKRDGRWQTVILPRSTIFNARSIISLADSGCTVTSENSRSLVKFFQAFEAANFDAIPIAESATGLGWKADGIFLPCRSSGIILDVEPTLKRWVAAYNCSGCYEDWIDLVGQHRHRDKFRFILAAAFAPPLLRIVSQRIFFVYNWGTSKGGKTAALKAALSVWGEPDGLMVNFNATSAALERLAGFFSDLPLGVDERQLAGSKQETLESIVYMIASGTGRARGTKTGGLQTLHTWRTICLATGEQPISTRTSQTGVATRVLEIYGSPFEDEETASQMHQMTAEVYGHAGEDFITHILSTDEHSIRNKFSLMKETLLASAKGASGAHIAGISVVALADAMIDSWIFQKERCVSSTERSHASMDNKLNISDESWNRAISMATKIIADQMSQKGGDVNENATQFVIDWIQSNWIRFGEDTEHEPYGFRSDDDNQFYIYPSILRSALDNAKYNDSKTLKFLAEKGIIQTAKKASGGREFTVVKSVNGKSIRVISFNLSKATGFLEGIK